MNVAVSPYVTIPGKKCVNDQKTKEQLCKELVNESKTYPYYYIHNNKTDIIYLNHVVSKTENGITINVEKSVKASYLINDITDKYFKCDNQASYINKTITVYDKYSIILPITETDTIIIKSMKNFNEHIEIQKSKQDMCAIFDDALLKAKPMQFPYSTFSEINDFEIKSPVSLLLAHLYYKHNDTNEGSFEDIINECCDIIDDSFFPECKTNEKIVFDLGECDEKSQMRKIIYKSCKTNNNTYFPVDEKCLYIPVYNIKGMILVIFSVISTIIELVFMIIIIIYRKENNINIAGFKYLLLLIFSTIMLNVSVNFWIGKNDYYKCIFKSWMLIIGINGFICSYSIKTQTINSIFANKKVTKGSSKYKIIMMHIILSICQYIMLIIWTFTQKGLTKKQKEIKNLGYYEYYTCSYGNQYILSIIFFINYVLLALSIYSAYKGRNIPNQFNFSRNILIISIISLFLLTLCYITAILQDENSKAVFVTIYLIILITLLINIMYIGSKILALFNINIGTDISVVVVNKNSNNANPSIIESNSFVL